MFDWGTPDLWFGISAAAAALSIGAVVASVRRDNPQNRALALVLGLEGAFVLTIGIGEAFGSGSARGQDLFTLTALLAVLLAFAYLALIGTLRLPGCPWADTATARLATTLVAVVAAPALVLGPAGDAGGAAIIAIGALIVTSILGFVAAIVAVATSEPTQAKRRKAWAFLAAFGARDLAFVALLVFVTINPALNADVPDPNSWQRTVADAGPAAITVLFALLLGIGILRTQLFDVDLKIKTGLHRTFVVGAFVVVFFAVSEAVEALAEARYGTIAGIAAAALLAIGAVPLGRAARALADRLMPNTQATPDYIAAQKERVYRAALEDALADARIATRESIMLDGLRKELGLEEEVAARIHEETRAAVSG